MFTTQKMINSKNYKKKVSMVEIFVVNMKKYSFFDDTAVIFIVCLFFYTNSKYINKRLLKFVNWN